MRIPISCLLVALALVGGSDATFAQNVANGQRLSERWCVGCHTIGTTPPGKHNKAMPLAAIAAKDNVTSDMIASFLLLPHATMPYVPLSRKDAQDIAAFIMGMKN